MDDGGVVILTGRVTTDVEQLVARRHLAVVRDVAEPIAYDGVRPDGRAGGALLETDWSD